MTRTSRVAVLHRIASLVAAAAVPAALFCINGVLEPWMFVLGAVIGFGCWYFFPFFLP
ncbi:MAG: hypothetical protein KDJ76_05380 [Xanthobacteraceae bacterium]|nr:hypothetical protein [Xanthobacteraceae bacterium]